MHESLLTAFPSCIQYVRLIGMLLFTEKNKFAAARAQEEKAAAEKGAGETETTEPAGETETGDAEETAAGETDSRPTSKEQTPVS